MGAMMGAAYSVDLRRKVVQACERGTASQAEVARLFGVSRSFVEKLLQLRSSTHTLPPAKEALEIVGGPANNNFRRMITAATKKRSWST